jgi:hypothetical protein
VLEDAPWQRELEPLRRALPDLLGATAEIDGGSATAVYRATPERVSVIAIAAQGEVVSTSAFRRPDGDAMNDRFRLYEIAGASHIDRSPYFSLLMFADQTAAGTPQGDPSWPFAAKCDPEIPLTELPLITYMFDSAGNQQKVKEASGNISQMATVLNEVPADFIVLSGDDAITIPLAALGGRGVISVASNEIPTEMTAITQACLRNDFAGARELQARFLPLMNVNFVESNPGPVKAAMALMGLLEPVWRLPMVPPGPANLAKIDTVLSSVGLLVHQ